MNASQRARRRERRKETRETKKCARLVSYTNYEKIFSFKNLLLSSYKCEAGVKWKREPQLCAIHRLTYVAKLYKELDDQTYKKRKAYHFTLRERGKERSISGVSYRDRIVQRTLCENSMIPVLCDSIVYDNTASQKGKGTDFARKRFFDHMRWAMKHFGNKGYILQYDFRHYFESIDSSTACNKILKEYYNYCKREDDCAAFEYLFQQILLEEKGVGLGNQTSQTTAIWYPNKIDHYIKEVLLCGKSGRYMDDGYIFCESQEKAIYVKNQLYKAASSLGLTLHPLKTKISPIAKELVFLKTAYRWNQKTNRIEHRLVQSVLTYNRRHMLSVARKVENGDILPQSLIDSLKSYLGVLSRANKKQLKWYDKHIKQPILNILINLGVDIEGI